MKIFLTEEFHLHNFEKFRDENFLLNNYNLNEVIEEIKKFYKKKESNVSNLSAKSGEIDNEINFNLTDKLLLSTEDNVENNDLINCEINSEENLENYTRNKQNYKISKSKNNKRNNNEREINLEMTEIKENEFNEKKNTQNFSIKKAKTYEWEKKQIENNFKEMNSINNRNKPFTPERILTEDNDNIFDEKGPQLFRLNMSELNYIFLWTIIKRIILFFCIVTATIFYCLIPILISHHRAK